MIDALEEDTVCPICETSDSTFLFHPVDYSGLTAPDSLGVVKCKECGLIRLDPRLKEEDVSQFYQGDFWQINVQGDDLRQLMCRSYRDRLRFLQSVSKPGRILDVGCGHGGYVWLLREMGWDAYGIDAYPGAAKLAKTVFDLDISVGDLSEVGYPLEYFQTVVVHHVLEHVYNPVKFMDDVTRILAAGGILLIEVPNGECCEYSLFKGYARGLATPKHVFFYSPQTLTELLKRIDCFEILKVQHSSHPHGVVWAREGLRRKLGNLRRTVLSSKKRDTISGEVPSKLVGQSVAGQPESTVKRLFLNLSGEVLARFWSSVGRGAVITMAVRKTSM